MEHLNKSPGELDPTNGNENIENLQVDTEENTQEVSAENNSEENQQQETTDNAAKGKRKYSKKNNRRIANLKNTKSLKKRKLARLKDERSSKKAAIRRGYLISNLNNNEEDSNPEHNKHVTLDPADKEILCSGITELDLDIYDLEQEVKKVNNQMFSLASAKTSTNRDKLNKKKESKKVDDLVDRVSRELTKASKNGSTGIISKIQLQAQTGNKNEAFETIKSFLADQVKTVSKKLDNSKQLQDNVLNRVIEKLSKVQS